MSNTSHERTSLQVRRLFAAPRERVFRAWIEPDAIEHWFRPGGSEVTVSHLDVRVGGSFRFDSRAANGTQAVTTGKYLEVRFPEKLAFTWITSINQNQEALVTVEFIQRGTSTEIILTHDRILRDTWFTILEQGWTSILDRLASIIEVSS